MEEFFNEELERHRQWLKKAKTKEEQDRILIQCDTISYLKQMYKVYKYEMR